MSVLARVPVIVFALLIANATLAVPMGTLAQDEATAAALAETAVAAQETATAEETPAQTATPTPETEQITVVVTNDATSIPLDPAMVLVLVLVLLLVALFALAEIFRYLRDGREDYYKTFREFARRGVYVEPVMVNATAQSSVREVGVGPEAAMLSSDLFEMAGPGFLTAGATGTYAATLNSSAAGGTEWRLKGPGNAVVPAENATLTVAADGASATLTARKSGSYIVGASPQGNPDVQASAAVTVVDPPAGDAKTPALPFIGEGYGSIVGAILLLAVVVVLAATRAIDADIIGVLLGSIAGYLFGVGVSKTTS